MNNYFKNGQLRLFINENKWLIAAIFFFIAWKFFLIGIFLSNGLNAPGSADDIASYVRHIESVKNCPSFIFCSTDNFTPNRYVFWEHLTYRLPLGSLAKILDITSYQAFKLNFYIGTILLLPVLVYFVKQFSDNKNLTALAIFFLALFNGAGTYHGFFWVVPSFFALLLFLLLFALILDDNKHWKIFSLLVIPAMVYSHTIGVYFSFILIAFCFFYSILSKRIEWTIIKKTAFVLFLLFLSYIAPSMFYKNNPYGPSGLSKESTAQIIKNGSHISQDKMENVASPGIFPGMIFLERDYFKFMFPHWSAAAIFSMLLLILAYYKQYKILAIFSASFIFTIFSSVNYYAFRSLILLWPLTYLIAAFFTFYGVKFIQEKIKSPVLRKFIFTIIVLSLSLFVFFNLRYSVILNQKQNISLNELFFR
ncbi:MAG: hypothetical protein Q8L11_03360 [Candidatus Moranbacteria bacterium]|nr:hypothetical protein [Candidatus Moranbacteria bacterium]